MVLVGILNPFSLVSMIRYICIKKVMTTYLIQNRQLCMYLMIRAL